jgi:hypothetical protein
MHCQCVADSDSAAKQNYSILIKYCSLYSTCTTLADYDMFPAGKFHCLARCVGLLTVVGTTKMPLVQTAELLLVGTIELLFVGNAVVRE